MPADSEHQPSATLMVAAKNLIDAYNALPDPPGLLWAAVDQLETALMDAEFAQPEALPEAPFAAIGSIESIGS
jgi:hypothetical protein